MQYNMQKQSLHSFGRTLTILSFLYISYSFVVSRPVSGTFRLILVQKASLLAQIRLTLKEDNFQSKSCQLAVECVWGRDDRQLLQLRQISVDTREAAELLRRTSWERNFVWKRSHRMMLHLFMGTIGLVLFV